VTFVSFVVAQTGAFDQRPDWRTTIGWVHPGFVWVPPKIRASPNFRATAQAGAAVTAPCDSCDGDPQETEKDHFFTADPVDRQAEDAGRTSGGGHLFGMAVYRTCAFYSQLIRHPTPAHPPSAHPRIRHPLIRSPATPPFSRVPDLTASRPWVES
jgi:hypothetical protein